jgi:hypothetical protein
MNQERVRETEIRKNEYLSKMEGLQKHKANLQDLKNDLYALFNETNAQKEERTLKKY